MRARNSCLTIGCRNARAAAGRPLIGGFDIAADCVEMSLNGEVALLIGPLSFNDIAHSKQLK
jgi:hypothetical protein